MKDFQADVERMVEMIGGTELLMDKAERNRRVAEEFCELLQASDFPLAELIGTARWVYAKDKGEVRGEVGDVMNCLSALCTAHQIGMTHAGSQKLNECFGRIDQIREKQARKPKTFITHSVETPRGHPGT